MAKKKPTRKKARRKAATAPPAPIEDEIPPYLTNRDIRLGRIMRWYRRERDQDPVGVDPLGCGPEVEALRARLLEMLKPGGNPKEVIQAGRVINGLRRTQVQLLAQRAAVEAAMMQAQVIADGGGEAAERTSDAGGEARAIHGQLEQLREMPPHEREAMG